MALWNFDKIQWQNFDPSLVDERLLRLAKGACLVESNADDYVKYLTNIFRGDDEFCEEIREWGEDENMHGAALARWVKLVEPSFNFEKSFEKFRVVHPIAIDAEASIRGSRARELVARCMVETGTASYYSALSDASREPVFKQICKYIAADEVHHYKLFLKKLDKYKKLDGLSFWKRFQTVLERSIEVEDEELSLAFACGNYPDREIRREDHKGYVQEFMAHATGIYRKPHIEKATRLAMNAAGLPNKKWLSKPLSSVLYGAVKLRQRSLA